MGYIKVKKESWFEHDKIAVTDRESSGRAKGCKN